MQRGGIRLEKAGESSWSLLAKIDPSAMTHPFRILHRDTTVFKLAISLYQPCNDQTAMIMRVAGSVKFLHIAKTQVNLTKGKRRKHLQRTKTYKISCQ